MKLPLPDERVEELVEKAKDFALMHGICMRRKDKFDRDCLHFAPFVLFPTPFPRQEFTKAMDLQPVLNELMHKVAHDHQFLKESLKHTISVDDFTGRLWNVYETVRNEGGSAQPVSLGMMRSDIMLDNQCCPTSDETSCCKKRGTFFCCWKQVELNTIASGFGWMGPASTLLHNYVVGELGPSSQSMLPNLPPNLALEGLAEGLITAWRYYNVPSSVIMFLIEDTTYNICDQKFHEFEIRKQCPEVFVIRKTLTQLTTEACLTEDKRLMVGEVEVAVIYMRCGYHPDQYPTQAEWDARLLMERSMAVKSPSIQYHLAGTKKIQQELAKPGVVEGFLKQQDTKSKAVKEIFTGLYTLDQDSLGDSTYQKAVTNPARYVLKPQREGGGNNVYGEDIKPFLESIKDSDERNAWILMDRIEPPVSRNYMVRPGQPVQLVKVISELGIFGWLLGDKDSIITNKTAGHMLRTKLSHVNEGGVAAGLGALDSVYLVDEERCC